MRTRLSLAAVMAAIVALPMAGATAREHCQIPIYLFSNFRVQTGQENPTSPGDELAPGNPTVTSSAIGCVAVGADEPDTPWDDTQSDFIYPGSNNFSVRWLEGAVPAFGTLEFGELTFDLEFKDGQGTTADQIDSQRVYFDPALSVGDAPAVITVCRDADGSSCETRTYWTLPNHPDLG